MTILVGAITAALVATAPAYSGYFTRDGRRFVSEHDVGGDTGESITEVSVTDLWTGTTENLAPTQHHLNCELLCAPAEGQKPNPATQAKQMAQCEAKNKASQTAFDASMRPWRDAAAPNTTTLTSRSGEAKFAVVAPVGQPTLMRDPTRPLEIWGGRDGEYILRLAVPGRPVREFKDHFDSSEKRKRTVFLVWSLDDQWVGYTRVGDLHPTAYPAIARVDMLDAGAGAKPTTALKKLEDAGYKPSHQGKAPETRKVSEIFVLPGFEADGKLVAKALKLPEDAVKPLTSASTYAVTVAAGSDLADKPKQESPAH